MKRLWAAVLVLMLATPGCAPQEAENTGLPWETLPPDRYAVVNEIDGAYLDGESACYERAFVLAYNAFAEEYGAEPIEQIVVFPYNMGDYDYVELSHFTTEANPIYGRMGMYLTIYEDYFHFTLTHDRNEMDEILAIVRTVLSVFYPDIERKEIESQSHWQTMIRDFPREGGRFHFFHESASYTHYNASAYSFTVTSSKHAPVDFDKFEPDPQGIERAALAFHQFNWINRLNAEKRNLFLGANISIRLADLDGDGVPEILVENEAPVSYKDAAHTEIYRFVSDDLEMMGAFDGRIEAWQRYRTPDGRKVALIDYTIDGGTMGSSVCSFLTELDLETMQPTILYLQITRGIYPDAHLDPDWMVYYTFDPTYPYRRELAMAGHSKDEEDGFLPITEEEYEAGRQQYLNSLVLDGDMNCKYILGYVMSESEARLSGEEYGLTLEEYQSPAGLQRYNDAIAAKVYEAWLALEGEMRVE